MKNLRGMSFVEVIVTLSIVAIIMVTISSSVIYFYRANKFSFEEAFQIQSAERGVNTLIHDLREATYGDDGSYPLAEMATSSITFYSDVDRTSPVERIRYQLSGTTLTRTSLGSAGTPPTYIGAAATSTISDFVRNTGDNIPLFRYYNSSGVEVTNPSDIADVVSVTVNVVVDITPIHAPGEFTLRSSATLRNLRPQ